MTIRSRYWGSYEKRISSLAGFLEAVRMISAYQSATGARFVWRGIADSRWPLYSSLVRSYIKQTGSIPTESQLRDAEREVIKEAHEWVLDWHPRGGRLTGLELLASLQHYGVPTRLLDFTFNPLIALWFAVEGASHPRGRVFAIDISERMIGREEASRPDPWWWSDWSPKAATGWTAQSWIWRPPPLEPRMVRQEGCFLMGGVPSTVPRRNVFDEGKWRSLVADEVRACMSVPLALINYEQAVRAYEGRKWVGKPPKAKAFTLRVGNKDVLRAEIEQAFSYSHSSLFPDFAGFATYRKAYNLP